MSAIDAMSQFDAGFALQAGELHGRLPPGRSSFALERLEVLRTLGAEDRVIAQAYQVEAFLAAHALYSPDALSLLAEHLLTLWFAPFDREAERHDVLRSVIAEIPLYLAEAITGMQDAHALALEAASEVAEDFTELMDRIAVAARARAAVKDYRRALKQRRLLDRKPLLGGDRFAELLTLKVLPYDPREIEALGEERFRKTKERRAKAIRLLTGFSDLRGALRAIAPPEPTLDVCRQARDFVGMKSLAPIPSDEGLHVVPRLWPFIDIITPKPRWPFQRSLLQVSTSKNDAAHYAYPGLHLRAAVANTKSKHPVAWSRDLGTETVLGWAHYSEAFMHAQRFHDSVADRVHVLNSSVHYAALMLIEARMQADTLSLTDAAQLLVDECALTPERAYREARQCLLTPGRALSYTLGKHMLRERRHRPDFAAAVMAHGYAPLVWLGQD